MKISVIIPYHKESDEKIFGTFDCLNSQQNIDFNDIEVIVSNDCNVEKPKILDSFKNLNIKYVNSIEQNSVSANNQNGLDNASGDYVLFIDDDDTLYDNLCLYDCLQFINKYKDYDIFHFDNTQEVKRNDKITVLKVIDYDAYKSAILYRRHFLLDNNIKFLNHIKLCEDTLFNLQCQLYKPKEVWSDRKLYIHKLNNESVTRFNFQEFLFKVSIDFITGLEYIIENSKNKIDNKYLSQIIDEYIDSFINRVVKQVKDKESLFKNIFNYIINKQLGDD